jgi:cytochrome c-type biogenesis protein CcmE
LADLDLTPQARTEATPTGAGRLRNWLILGALVLAGGFVLYQALTSARVFFLNVDEAVAQRAELGDQVFRIQGTVVSEPVSQTDGALRFTINYGGVDAEINHVGLEPSSLFDLGQAVVAEGSWDGSVFESTLVTVKHAEAYVEDNPDRVDYDLDDPRVSEVGQSGDPVAGG